MRITSARIGTPIRHPAEVFGDSWAATWADDDAVYASADDTRGFGGDCSSNLAVSRIDGLFATHAHYALRLVPMDLEVDDDA